MRLALGLSPEDLKRRRSFIGGSDANRIMNGDWLSLWEEKTGRKEAENLSDVLPVMLGQWTEEFNRYWYEKQTGRLVTNEGDWGVSESHGFMASTVDGLTPTEAGERAIFEAKHVNPFGDIENVVQRYMPQLHHNAFVHGVDWAVLSVLIGTMKWEAFEVQVDPIYLGKLIEREAAFWSHVTSDEPPHDPDAVQAPAPDVSEMREVDMTGDNMWAASAVDWLEHKDAAGKFRKAEKILKELVANDVRHAFGAGVQVKRAKNGSLRITEVR